MAYDQAKVQIYNITRYRSAPLLYSPTCLRCSGIGWSSAVASATLLLPFFTLPTLSTYEEAPDIGTPTIPFWKSTVGVLAVDLL